MSTERFATVIVVGISQCLLLDSSNVGGIGWISVSVKANFWSSERCVVWGGALMRFPLRSQP